ncbi:MAG: sulfite exporter TauE/SafE family protein [Pseudomonadota bacterium]|nr:sulfite exporter TauE/SafE family protein [Pseudomonadota bacterium]
MFVDNPWLLATLLGMAAALHSAVGLAGGSSFTALLGLFGLPVHIVPGISLSLNTLSSSIASFRYIRSGHFRLPLLLPCLLGAMPSAYLCAQIQLTATVFYFLLGATLALISLRLLCSSPLAHSSEATAPAMIIRPMQWWCLGIIIGLMLGALSGLLGIGGGVLLVPLLIFLGVANAKQAAACGVVFILCNSLMGLLGKWQAGWLAFDLILPFIIMVTLGAALGSYLGAKRLAPHQMHRILGIVLAVAAVLLIQKGRSYGYVQ